MPHLRRRGPWGPHRARNNPSFRPTQSESGLHAESPSRNPELSFFSIKKLLRRGSRELAALQYRSHQAPHGDTVNVKAIVLGVACLVPCALVAQNTIRHQVYFGAMGGVATLSGDASAVITPTAASTSSCDPSNKNIHYQQNLTKRRIAILVLENAQWPILRPRVGRVVAAVNAATPGSYSEVQIPHIG